VSKETILVKLAKSHEHEGRVYPAGGQIELAAADARWLIGIGVASAADTNAPQAQPTQSRTNKE
jgi:hypothetical protein